MKEQPWLPARVGLSRLRRWHKVAWVALYASAIASVGSCAGFMASGPLLLFFFPAVLALFAASIVLGMSERPTIRTGVFAIEGDRVRVNVDGIAGAVARADVENGWLEEPCELHVQTRDGWHVTIAAEDAEEADEAARALGVGVETRVMRVELPSAASRAAGGTVLAVLGALVAALFALTMVLTTAGIFAAERAPGEMVGVVLGALMTLAMGGAAAAMALRLVRALRPPELVIGADGVKLARPKTFVPLSDIARVLPDARGLEIVRQSGATVFVPTWSRGEPLLSVSPDVPDPPSPGARLRRTIFERLEEARARGGEGRGARAAMLDRGALDLGAWIASLRALPGGGGGFRAFGISEDELEGVIADGTAEAERRVGAAIALAAREPDRARARVRVAAEVCADERLRVALEKAAEGEIDEEYLDEAARRRA